MLLPLLLLLLLHAGIQHMNVSCCRSLREVPDELRALRRQLEDPWRIMIFCCEALGV